MKSRIASFSFALLAGSFLVASQSFAHCGSCGVGDEPAAADADHASCSASCESECCEDTGYALVGEVVNVMPDKRMVVVKHEEIKGVMAAMTMGFSVPEDFDLSTLKKGEKINARMIRDGNGYLLKFITPAKAGA